MRLRGVQSQLARCFRAVPSGGRTPVPPWSGRLAGMLAYMLVCMSACMHVCMQVGRQACLRGQGGGEPCRS